MDDPIERAAKVHYETTVADGRTLHWGGGPVPWEGLTQNERDIRYDAMHAALKELREPTEEMVDEGARAHLASSGDLKQTTRRQHRAMIDKLLEVK